MSTTPIFSINISYKDGLGNERSFEIPLNDKQYIKIKAFQDSYQIIDSRHLKLTNSNKLILLAYHH